MLNSSGLSSWSVGPNYKLTRLHESNEASGIHKPTGKKVMVRRYRYFFDDIIETQRILIEIKLLRKLQHSSLLHIIEIIEPTDMTTFDTLYIVFEYVQADFKKLIKSPIHLQTEHLQYLMYNILVGVKFIHSANIVHEGIKPTSIRVDEDCAIKICGFGLYKYIEPLKNQEESKKEEAKKDDPEEVASSIEEKKIKKPGRLTKLVRSKIPLVRRQLCRTFTLTNIYKAPEITLQKDSSTPASDIWSLGCIFADLLCMMQAVAPTFLDRFTIFVQTPIYPSYSRYEKKTEDFPESFQNELENIFSVLGTPKEEDFSFIKDEKLLSFIRSFPEKKPVKLEELYPGVLPEALDLLEKMLKFNPKKRLTAEGCLHHPFFNSIRQEKREDTTSEVITLDCELGKELTPKRLREMLVEEISYYKKAEF